MSQSGPSPTRPRETVFLVIAHDAENSAPARQSAMLGHLSHMEAHIDRYLLAGPAFVADNLINASVLIVRAVDEQAARALIETDPYFRAGVWRHLEIRSFRAVCGTAMGGITWDSVLHTS